MCLELTIRNPHSENTFYVLLIFITLKPQEMLWQNSSVSPLSHTSSPFSLVLHRGRQSNTWERHVGTLTNQRYTIKSSLASWPIETSWRRVFVTMLDRGRVKGQKAIRMTAEKLVSRFFDSMELCSVVRNTTCLTASTHMIEFSNKSWWGIDLHAL